MSKRHRTSPPENLECSAYLIDIDESLYAEFQTSDGLWYPSPYCSEVIVELLRNGFDKYLCAIDQATCKSHLIRVIQRGPPLYLEDPTFNVDEHLHITHVWFMKDNRTIIAKYNNAPEGVQREIMWKKHKLIFDSLPEKETN